MKGLLLKDLINLRKYGWSALLIIGLYVIFSFSLSDSGFMSVMIVLMFSMIAITSFSYDNIAGWDKYALSLPVSRKTIVKSKYVLSLLLSFLGAVMSALSGIVMSLFKGTADVPELLLMSLGLFCVSAFFLCIMLPLIFKFGVEKSRIMIIIVFAIPYASIFALSQSGAIMPTQEQLMRLIAYFPIVLAAFFVFSYMLSRYFFEKKEM